MADSPVRQISNVKEEKPSTHRDFMEFGCIPLELISNLGLEKHWKAKLKAITEIDLILDSP